MAINLLLSPRSLSLASIALPLILSLHNTSGQPWPRHTIDDSSVGADGVRLSDVNNDGLQDIVTGWEEGGTVRAYLHPAPSNTKEPWPSVTVGKAPAVEDAAFADLDGDGNVDVISASEGNTRRLSIHWAPNDRASYLKATAWKTDLVPSSIDVTRWMFTVPLQIDNQDGIDLLAGSKDPNGQLAWFQSPPRPRTMDQWIRHPLRQAGWIMSMQAVDMDGDGDLDLLFSDRKGPRRGCFWLERPATNPDRPWKEHPVGALNQEAMFLTRADLDQDGLQDIVIAVRRTSILFLRALKPGGISWQPYQIDFPSQAGGAKAVAVGDINQDGKNDIVLTCEGARDKSGIMWLTPQHAHTDPGWIATDISGPVGTKYDRIELLDIDHDGDLDVLTCEERESLGVFWHENPLK